jgi:tetratricopeptide (TPR) repeat protein
MEKFVNYYLELELDPALSCQEIEKTLKARRKYWKSHLNAPTLEKRQEAEIKCKLIAEAFEILLDENKRAAYDYKVRQNGSGNTETGPTQGKEKEKAKTLDYNDVDSILEICHQLVAEENSNELQRLTLNAIRHGIQNDVIYFYYGLSCSVQENYSEAEKAYKLALELAPHHETYTQRYAEVLVNLKRHDEAKDLYFELYNNGQNGLEVTVGLVRCLFELNPEPMASKILAEYIGKNPTDMGFKRTAQKEYLNAILRVKSTYLYSSPNQAQIDEMMSYAQKANSILPNNRAKEAIEEINALSPTTPSSSTTPNNGGKKKVDPPKPTNTSTSKIAQNINLISVLSIVLAFIYPVVGFILGVLTIKNAQLPQDKQYKNRGIISILICAGWLFIFIVAIAASM